MALQWYQNSGVDQLIKVSKLAGHFPTTAFKQTALPAKFSSSFSSSIGNQGCGRSSLGRSC